MNWYSEIFENFYRVVYARRDLARKSKTTQFLAFLILFSIISRRID